MTWDIALIWARQSSPACQSATMYFATTAWLTVTGTAGAGAQLSKADGTLGEIVTMRVTTV